MPVSGKLSAPPPGTGAVGHEEAEESADEDAFNNIIGWHGFHDFSLGQVEDQEPYGCSSKYGDEAFPEVRCLDKSFEPAALWFDFQFLELHIYDNIYINTCVKLKIIFVFSISGSDSVRVREPINPIFC